MSDTTKEVQTNTEPRQDEVQPNVSEETAKPRQDVSNQAEETMSRSKFEELVAKARREEKDKLYKSMEKTKSELQEAQSQNEAVQKELTETKERLQASEESTMSEMQKVQEALSLLKEQNEMLQKRLDEVAQEADLKVKRSELNSYKKERIEQEGLMLSELIDGASQEEIDSAIQAVKTREDLLRKSLEEKVRKELSAELPRPLSVDSQESSVAPASDRYRLSKLNPNDYQTMRQQLMQKALESFK